MSQIKQAEIQVRLERILDELTRQSDVSASYPPDTLPFDEEMKQVREYIDVGGEYGIAYESLVATIESHPFVLSGKAAISLLELGLLFGYKTGLDEDRVFDRR